MSAPSRLVRLSLALGVRLSLALLAVAGACSDPSGLRVDVNLAGFETSLTTLTLAISATPGGFASRSAESSGGVTLTTEDADLDQVLDLVVRFESAAGYHFGKSLSFRVETGNRADLSMHVEALGAGAAGTIAGGGATAPLSGGGHVTIAFALEPRTGPVNPMTVTTDLGGAGTADQVFRGPHKDANVSSVALCNVDGDENLDLVLGVPNAAPNTALNATGAVYVIFGGKPPPASVDLGSPPPATREFHVYGAVSGDRLGTAVACADVDGDTYDDLIMGAPRAGSGAGAVYVLQGRAALPNTVFDLSKLPPAPDAPNVTFVGAAGASLGSALHAANLDADSGATAEVLISAPGEGGVGRVHLLTRVLGSGGWSGRQVLDAGARAHVTFPGIAATSMAAGDLDGSGGFLDVILGDPSFKMQTDTAARGAAYVFSAVDPAGQQALDVGQAKLALVGAAARAAFGTAVLVLDTQARGAEDLLVGAPGDTDGTGAVNIYTNDATIFSTPMRDPNKTLRGLAVNDRFGGALAGASTVGGTRLFVGAQAASPGGRTGAGAAYVYRGSAAGPVLVEQIFGAAAGDALGTALAGGELGGTAISDVVVIAPGAAGTETGAGVAYVRFGRAQ